MTDQYVAIVMAPNSRGPEYVYGPLGAGSSLQDAPAFAGPFPCSREDDLRMQERPVGAFSSKHL